eukprot:scaffold49221_cov49-Phaeocystis_antarctica.AAC.1
MSKKGGRTVVGTILGPGARGNAPLCGLSRWQLRIAQAIPLDGRPRPSLPSVGKAKRAGAYAWGGCGGELWHHARGTTLSTRASALPPCAKWRWGSPSEPVTSAGGGDGGVATHSSNGPSVTKS